MTLMGEHEHTEGRLGREVREVMTPGVVSVPGDASLRQVYGALAAHGVHAVLVDDRKTGAPLGWISAQGLLHWAMKAGHQQTAHQAICEPIHTVSPSARVGEAVELLLQPGVSHVLVAHAGSATGEGVVSALDIAGLLSGR